MKGNTNLFLEHYVNRLYDLIFFLLKLILEAISMIRINKPTEKLHWLLYVNLTQIRVIKEEGKSVEEMLP